MKFLERNKKKAFTLIELLIVVAVIGVLSAVVVTNTGEARRKADLVRTTKVIQQYIDAIELTKHPSGLYYDIKFISDGYESNCLGPDVKKRISGYCFYPNAKTRFSSYMSGGYMVVSGYWLNRLLATSILGVDPKQSGSDSKETLEKLPTVLKSPVLISKTLKSGYYQENGSSYITGARYTCPYSIRFDHIKLNKNQFPELYSYKELLNTSYNPNYPSVFYGFCKYFEILWPVENYKKLTIAEANTRDEEICGFNTNLVSVIALPDVDMVKNSSGINVPIAFSCRYLSPQP